MIIKKGLKKKLDLLCVQGSVPAEVKLPKEITNIYWIVENPEVASIVATKDSAEVTALKKGKTKINAVASRTSVKTGLTIERYVTSIPLEVQDDANPDEVKTSVTSIVIREKNA